MKTTMKAMSLQEQENLKRLDFMVPMNIIGRHQILTKLKDLTIDVSEVIVKPVDTIPSIIRKVVPYFSPDGYWEGNFVAYGTDLKGYPILLWDDIHIDAIPHYTHMVETYYVKQKLDCTQPATLITAIKRNNGYALVFYCYLP